MAITTACRSSRSGIESEPAKGQLVAVKGRLQQRDWTDKQGNKRRTTEILADRCYFAEKRQDRDASSGGFQQMPDSTPVPFEDPDDNDLPF